MEIHRDFMGSFGMASGNSQGSSWDLCAMDLRQVNIHGSPVRHCAMLRQAEIEALFEMRQLMEQQEFLERRQDDSGEGDVPWSFNM